MPLTPHPDDDDNNNARPVLVLSKSSTYTYFPSTWLPKRILSRRQQRSNTFTQDQPWFPRTPSFTMSEHEMSEVKDVSPAPISPTFRDVATSHDPALSDVASSQDSASPSWDGQLCLVCREMLSTSFQFKMRTYGTGSHKGDHHSSLTALRATAALGCFICSEFIAALTQGSKDILEEDSRSVFRTEIYAYDDYVEISLRQAGAHGNSTGIASSRLPVTLRCSIPLRKNTFEIDLISLSRGRHKSNNERTLALAEEWLKICAHTHGNVRSSDGQNLYLLDCWT